MKVLKGILIYSVITLVAFIVLVAILFGIMYFFPSIRIFNIGLIHYNEVIDSDDITWNNSLNIPN